MISTPNQASLMPLSHSNLEKKMRLKEKNFVVDYKLHKAQN
jgi:hypothetical protein